MRTNTLKQIGAICAIIFSLHGTSQVNWYWTRQGDSASANASQVATDRKNNVYYTGYASSGSRVAFGNKGLNITGIQSDFLVKYDPNGTPLWANNATSLTPGTQVFGMSVATDRNNNVIEAGYYDDSIAFGATHLSAKNQAESSYLVKYTSTGTLLWARTPKFSHSTSNYAYGVAADKHNNIYMAGYYSDTVIFGADTLKAAGIDMYLVKYDALGNVLWARTPTLGASAHVYGLSVAVDDSCNAFVSGNFFKQVTFGGISKTAAGQDMVYVTKFDSAGNSKWVVNTGATPGQICPTPLAVDLTNNVYVSAQFSNPSLVIGAYTVTDGASPCSNALLAKYDRNGNPLWATCAAFISQQEVCVIVESSVTTDKCNNVYWSGFCSDTFAVGCVKVTVPGANINLSKPFSYFMRLDSAGTAFCGVALDCNNQQFFSNGLATDSLSRVLFASDLYSPSTLVIGNDTVNQYQGQPTTFLTKFSIVPTIYGNDSICKGDSTTLKVKLCSNSTYEWSTGATTDSITVKPLVTTRYYITTSNCSTDTSYVTVFVGTANPLITGKDSICKGDSIWLVGHGGLKYKWNNNLTTDSIHVSPASTTTYTLMANTGGCTKDTTFTVVVKPSPIPGIAVTPLSDSICVGDSALLAGSGGCKYLWTNTAQTQDSIWVKPPSTTTYTLQVTCLGCTSKITQKITVVAPAAQGIILAKDSICTNDSTTMTAFGGTKYKWLAPIPPSFQNNATVTVKGTPPGTTFKVVVFSPCGTDTLSKVLHVTPLPVISVSGIPNMCLGYNTTLNASGGSTYTWTPSAGLSCNNCPNPTITLNSNNTYTLTVSNGRCASDTVIKVTVQPPPTVNITATPPSLCYGSSTTLTATGGGTYSWSNGATTNTITVSPGHDITYRVVVNDGCIDSNRVTIPVDSPYFQACCDSCIIKGSTIDIGAYGVGMAYAWSPAAGLSCDNCPFPQATPTKTTTYTVCAVDAKGCKTCRVVTVCLECLDFNVPNVFTPNDDGINDDFEVMINNYTTYSIQIFDRWGKKVYSSTDPTVYWTGRVQGTENMVPDGTYFYEIDATCDSNTYKKKGFVQVIASAVK